MLMEGLEKGKSFLVVGSGGSIKQYRSHILSLVNKINPVVIGVNAMTDLCCPHYHLWTNRKQFLTLGNCISNESELIVGPSIDEKMVRQFYKGRYFRLETDKISKISRYQNRVNGDFRTAGSLAIVVADLMGASEILVAGMDGYTLHPRKDVESGKEDQHCYGKGHTDDADWEDCLKKDEEVYENLISIKESGIEFSIITPTKFQKFYDGNQLL